MSINIITPTETHEVSTYTLSDVDMGLNNITLDLKLPQNVDPEFTLDWHVEYNGEKYYLQTLQPTAIKDNSSLKYKYSLTFNSARYELNFVEFLDLVEIDANNILPRSSDFTFNGTLEEFVYRFNLNLKFYFGDKWIMVNESDSSEDRVLVTSSKSSIWSILSSVYELYGVRWTINHTNGKYEIKVGALPIEVEHIFEYGIDTGSYSIERINPMKDIYTRLRGKGSSKNLPFSYFHNGDPDTNNIVDKMFYNGVMPISYRDYIRGWNTGVVVVGESDAYNIGATDKIDGNRFQPIDYSDYNTDKWGIRYGSLANNEEIYPTIQGIEVAGVGRIDEVVAVEQVTNDDWQSGDEGGFSLYYDIWIKDVGFDLLDPKYWTSEFMTVMYSDGLLAGEDYEYQIMAEQKDGKIINPYIFLDDSKEFNGVRSKYRIKLQKSDAEKEASGLYLPNIMQQGKAGDHFFFINIQLPHSYITEAERRVQSWLDAEVLKTSDESPTFSTKLSSIFFESFTEKAKVRCGAKLRLRNEKLIGDSYLPVYIQSKTVKYTEGKLLPAIDIVLSDDVVANKNAVEMLQSSVNSLNSGYLSKSAISEITRNMERFFLRKDGISDISFSPTTFNAGVRFGSEIKSNNYNQGDFGGAGWAVGKDANGDSVIEIDKAIIRKQLTVNELVINQVTWVGGVNIYSAAGMTCSIVEDFTDYYRCYFDTKNGSVYNQFVVGDQAYSQRYDAASNSIIKYYWRLVAGVGSDYIDLSKTDKDGDGLPFSNDDIVQIGHRTDKTRQNVIIIAAHGSGSPSFTQYAGIDSFSFEGKDVTVLSPNGNKIDGKVVIREGSIGYENIAGLSDRFNALYSGSVNLIRNSGFTGDYTSLDLLPDTQLEPNTALYSKNLKYWDGSGNVIEDVNSRSGFSVQLNNQQITQTISPLIDGESYIVSFKAKGSQAIINVGDYSETVELSSEYSLYSYKFTSNNSTSIFVWGVCDLCEIMLERGNIRSDWSFSPLDNDKSMELFESIRHITDAIINGSTTIRGGLIMSAQMMLGNFLNGIMSEVTAGMSGTYNKGADPAFWSGGDLESAIKAVLNPFEKLGTASTVITHGGALVSNSATIRGKVYAEEGEFNGKVSIADGKILLDEDGSGHLADGNISWDINGNPVVRGKIESNSDGNRVVINPITRQIDLLNPSGQYLGTWGFGDNYSLLQIFSRIADGQESQVQINGTSMSFSYKPPSGGSFNSRIGVGGTKFDITLYPTKDRLADLEIGEQYRDGDVIKMKIVN